jgi:hypothetical protein
MAALNGPPWLPRCLALLLALVGVPLVLSSSAFLQDTPIRLGEPAPRTVVAPDLIRQQDPVATERARRDAMASVTPIMVDDEDARVAIVEDVRDAFARVEAVRATGEGVASQTRTEQIDQLAGLLPMLTSEGLRVVTGLSDSQLQQTAGIAENVALGDRHPLLPPGGRRARGRADHRGCAAPDGARGHSGHRGGAAAGRERRGPRRAALHPGHGHRQRG